MSSLAAVSIVPLPGCLFVWLRRPSLPAVQSPAMSRRRRVLKRAGVVLCVVILGAWAVSTRLGARYIRSTDSGSWSVGINDGTIGFSSDESFMYSQPNTGVWLRPNRGDTYGFRMPRLSKSTRPDTLARRCGGFGEIRQRESVASRGSSRTPASMVAVRSCSVPLWLPFLIVALPTAFMFYRDRKRIPPGHCKTCGYNLTGAEHERCPECGVACDSAGQRA